MPSGTQYLISGSLVGDQTSPHISVNSSGGYMTWQDNVTDGDGLGISARKIDRNFSGVFGSFRVNAQGAGDQEKPKVAMLGNGGAVFVWQGGPLGSQRIYARFLNPDRTFATSDVLVNTYAQNQQTDPAVAIQTDGNILIAWSSFGQDGSMQGIFAQRFSPAGVKVGAEFQVNQTTSYNQRNPAVASLSNGQAVVVWISESGSDAVDFASGFRVDIVGCLLSPGGAGAEFRINTGTNVCAHPAVGTASDGGFLVVWAQRDPTVTETSTNSWDVFGRAFQANGVARGPDRRINTFAYGDQFVPKVAGGKDYLVVWTSLGQDGSREGVFGQFLAPDGTSIGGELLVNTATASRQIDPFPATNGNDRYAVLWSGFIGGPASYELFAQRYEAVALTLPAPEAPFVSGLSQTRLSVTWSALDGLALDHYELYVDDATTPINLTSNMWTASGLAPGSTHSFRLAYQLADGRRSEASAAGQGTTWQEDTNFDGLPDDWQTTYWGTNPASWPSVQVDSDGDGATNLQEFLAGTDPTDPESVLRMQIVSTSQGGRLSWNTVPGLMYQVQVSNDLKSWNNIGSARFAAGASDSLTISGADAAAYYRMNRLR